MTHLARALVVLLTLAVWPTGGGQKVFAQPLPLPPGQWTPLPNTAVSAVFFRLPDGRTMNDEIKGCGRPSNIIAAWNGAAYDTDRDLLIIAAAGGHCDYAGYETYTFDAKAGKWRRDNDPDVNVIPYRLLSGGWGSPPATSSPPSYTLPDGQRVPASRHVYNGLAYIPDPVGAVLLIGGSKWWDSGGASDTWLWRVLGKVWAPTLSPPVGGGDLGINSAWDSNQKRVLYHTYSSLRAFDPASASTAPHPQVSTAEEADSQIRFFTALFDPIRKRYVMAGPAGIDYYDVGGAPPYARKKLALSGTAWPALYAPGFDYDVARDRYTMWIGGNALYHITPAGVVSVEQGTGVVVPVAQQNGTFGRFRYSKSLDRFVLVTGPDDNALVIQPAAPPVVVPPPPPPPSLFPLTVLVSGTGTGTASGGGQYAAGTLVSPKVAPDAGFAVDRWNPTDCGAPFPMPAAAKTCTALLASVVSPPPPPPPPPVVPPSAGAIPPRVFVALATPPAGKGIPAAHGMKHVTGTFHPPSGRLFFAGGDYRSVRFPDWQSYNQEIWSLSLGERLANLTDPTAGWRMEYDYCGPVGGVQAKHPDFMGWQWDPKRAVFWLVPGVMELGTSGQTCPGETATRSSDPGFLYYHIMTFDPEKTMIERFKDISPNPGNTLETWMSILDPVTDTLTRFWHSSSSGTMVSRYSLSGDVWTEWGVGPNALGSDIRLNKEYLTADLMGRFIYGIDGISGRLHRFGLDTLKMEDLGPVPGGAYGSENYMNPVWDSVNKVLLWLRPEGNAVYVYHPKTVDPLDAHSVPPTWETIPIVTSPLGLPVMARSVSFDPANNGAIFWGGVEPTNPFLFFFRYAEGAVVPQPTSYPITLTQLGQGAVSGPASAVAGTTVTLMATPAAGWTFSGWGAPCAPSFTMLANAVTCPATFAQIPPPPPPPVPVVSDVEIKLGPAIKYKIQGGVLVP